MIMRPIVGENVRYGTLTALIRTMMNRFFIALKLVIGIFVYFLYNAITNRLTYIVKSSAIFVNIKMRRKAGN